jgi:hypothetical protein
VKIPVSLLALALLLAGCGGGPARQARAVRPVSWRSLPPAPIHADAAIAGAWTGKELIVTGVRAGSDGTFVGATNVAAAYDPATRTWRRLRPAPKMDDYCSRSVAWTGRELVLWGCSAAAFDPRAGAWHMLPKPPAGQGIALWTGRELIGWGGGCCGDAWDGGSAYDPRAGSWRTIAKSPLAPSQGPLGAWDGHELLLLVDGINPASGKPYPAALARAAAYDPSTDTWRRIAAPPGLGRAAVWDGGELVLLGAGSDARSTFAYDPVAKRWRRRAPSPIGLWSATAFRDGGRLVVLGGGEMVRALSYDPSADRWTLLPAAPLKGPEQTAVWAGDRLIVWSTAGGAELTERSSR